jgi:hypothetical protein
MLEPPTFIYYFCSHDEYSNRFFLGSDFFLVCGERPSQQTSGGNMTDDFEYCEDLNGDGFCDITHLSDGTTMIEDQAEIERLKEGNDGSPDTQQQRQPSGSPYVFDTNTF